MVSTVIVNVQKSEGAIMHTPKLVYGIVRWINNSYNIGMKRKSNDWQTSIDPRPIVGKKHISSPTRLVVRYLVHIVQLVGVCFHSGLQVIGQVCVVAWAWFVEGVPQGKNRVYGLYMLIPVPPTVEIWPKYIPHTPTKLKPPIDCQWKPSHAPAGCYWSPSAYAVFANTYCNRKTLLQWGAWGRYCLKTD